MNQMGDTSHNDRVQDGRHLMEQDDAGPLPLGVSRLRMGQLKPQLSALPRPTLEQGRRDSFAALVDSFVASAVAMRRVYRV